MARSYKLMSTKDGSKKGRQIHHRAYRRHVKQTLQFWITTQNYNEPIFLSEYMRSWSDDPEFKHPYQITNQYDICDWIWGYWSYDGSEFIGDKPCGTHLFKGKPNRIAK